MKRARMAAGAACLLAAIGGASWLEASMLRHMLLQLPLIVAAGALLGAPLVPVRRMAAIDEHGLTVLSALMFISAYWMIPRALELSLAGGMTEAAKFLSLFAIGMLLPGAAQRANIVIQLFFLGNFCAMTAIAGMLYQELPQRLCNAYLLDDQAHTGMALVAASVGVALAWSALQLRHPTFNPGTEPCTMN